MAENKQHITLSEVVREAYNVAYRATGNAGKTVSRFLGYFTAGLFAPHYAPTAVRRWNTLSEDYWGNEDRVTPSFVGCLLGTFGSLSFYIVMASDGKPELLFIPAATNIASGIYEAFRAAKNNLEKKYNKKE